MNNQGDKNIKYDPKEDKNKDVLFGFLILTSLIFFWIVFSFLGALILTSIGAVIFQKIKKEKKGIEKMMAIGIGIFIVLILLAIFGPAIQSDKEFRDERDKIITGNSQEFNYLTEEDSIDRDIELKVMDIIGYKTNRNNQKIGKVQIDNGLVYLSFIGDSNLSTSMTKRGMLSEVGDLLEKLPQEDSRIDEIEIEIWFPLVDEHGNTEMDSVMKVNATKNNWQKINWDNFLTENIPNVVDSYWIHPALQE